MNLIAQPRPLHLPDSKWSCAAFVLSILTNERIERINERLKKLRQRSNWKATTIRSNMHWMYDYEIRHFLRPLTRKTRCVFPVETLRVHELAKQCKREDVVVVMIDYHLLIIHRNNIWDAQGCNRWAEGLFGYANVIWYQHCKQ